MSTQEISLFLLLAFVTFGDLIVISLNFHSHTDVPHQAPNTTSLIRVLEVAGGTNL